MSLTASATTSRPRSAPSQPTTTTVRPAASAACLRLDQLGARGQCPVGQQPAAADERPHVPRRRRARRALDVLETSRRTAACRPGRAAPLATARATGCSEACSSAPASRSSCSRSVTDGRDDIEQGHRARRHRAGLVQHHGVDPARRFQHLRALDEQTELRAAPGTDEQRGRRGQPERARAGDDDHCDGRGERVNRAGADRERDDRASATASTSTTGTKIIEMRSASRCTGALPVCASRTSRAICASVVSDADAGGTHDQPAARVHRRAGDGVTDADLDGHRLARQQRLVDRRGPFDDDAVGRELLPGPGEEQFARARADRSAMRVSTPSRTTDDVLRAQMRATRSGPHRSGAWPAPRDSGRASRNTTTADATSR